MERVKQDFLFRREQHIILFLGFKISECKQESGCKFLMSPGEGAGPGVTFFETGAGVKKRLRPPLHSKHLTPTMRVLFASALIHVCVP